MRKIFLALGILSMGLLTSCQMEEYTLEGQPNAADAVVTASLGDMPETRTEMERTENGSKILWTKDDQISVFTSLTAHAQFALQNGAGQTSADFNFIGGSLNWSTSEKDPFTNVAVYPYNANITIAQEGENYLINTEIPALQAYAQNSFGQGASPMVAIHQSLSEFAFKNVASFLIMPLYGTEVIAQATLESKSHKIAGAATITAAVANNALPEVNVENGVSVVELVCGDGVQLSETEATNFTFVLAPGTYEANDLVVRFYTATGDFFETEITAENTFTRSKSRTFSARTFEVSGTKPLDLWIKAEAGAYMEGQRIIPSINDINIEEWVRNLSEQEDPRALIEEVITYIALKNYEAAYDALGGIPGFVRDYETFRATGKSFIKVDFTGAGYATSFLDKIDNVKDIYSLIEFMEEFEKEYEAYGLTEQMNGALGNVGKYFEDFLNIFVGNNVEGEDPDYATAIEAYRAKVIENLNSTITNADNTIAAIEAIRKLNANSFEEEYQAIVAYRAAAIALRDDLQNNPDKYETKEAIEAAVAALPEIDLIEGKDSAELDAKKAELAQLEAELQAMKEAYQAENQDLQDQLAQLEKELAELQEAYKKQLEQELAQLKQELAELKAAYEAATSWEKAKLWLQIEAKEAEIKIKESDLLAEYTSTEILAKKAQIEAVKLQLEGLTNTEILAKEAQIAALKAEIATLEATQNGFSFKPMDLLTGADDAYNNLKNEIDNNLNLELDGAQKALIETLRKEIADFDVIEEFKRLVEKQENGEELNYIEQLTLKFITAVFSESNQTVMDGVKKTLRTLVEQIEELAKENVNNGNVTAKRAAIELAKIEAFKQARVDALKRVEAAYNNTNEQNIANLGNGAWGIFKKVLAWEKCITLFEQFKMLQVYNALLDLVKIVEEMVRYDEGEYYFDIPNMADYQENVDWWVITANEMI